MAQFKVTPIAGSKAVTAAGTAEPLVDDETPTAAFTIVALVANTGNIYLGDSTVDKTSPQQIIIPSGCSAVVEAPEGRHYDLADWYIDADQDGDGVEFIYDAAA